MFFIFYFILLLHNIKFSKLFLPQELVRTLTDLANGKKNASFCKEHTLEKFYHHIMPTLENMNKQFEQPFLLQVTFTETP